MKESLIKLFTRDLDRVKAEIMAYANEEDLWHLEGEILNTPANIAMHISGNLLHFFGAVLSMNGYVRDRDFEFNGVGVPRDQIIEDLDKAKGVVIAALEHMNDDDWEKPFPIEVFGHPMTNEYFIIHLYSHIGWHLGQINYHRRLLSMSDE